MKETKTKAMQHGEVVAVESNAETFGIIFNVSELLALQAKYTELKGECKRFADFVINRSHGLDVTTFQFENEYLSDAARVMVKGIRTIRNVNPEEIIKELKK